MNICLVAAQFTFAQLSVSKRFKATTGLTTKEAIRQTIRKLLVQECHMLNYPLPHDAPTLPQIVPHHICAAEQKKKSKEWTAL